MIYLIQQGEDGPVKIGYTGGDVRQRLANFQTGHSETLHLRAAVEGTLEDEKDLQRCMGEFHIRGEWFSPLVLTVVDNPIDDPADLEAKYTKIVDYNRRHRRWTRWGILGRRGLTEEGFTWLAQLERFCADEGLDLEEAFHGGYPAREAA
jgi:hypothetical protein